MKKQLFLPYLSLFSKLHNKELDSYHQALRKALKILLKRNNFSILDLKTKAKWLLYESFQNLLTNFMLNIQSWPLLYLIYLHVATIFYFMP